MLKQLENQLETRFIVLSGGKIKQGFNYYKYENHTLIAKHTYCAALIKQQNNMTLKFQNT